MFLFHLKWHHKNPNTWQCILQLQHWTFEPCRDEGIMVIRKLLSTYPNWLAFCSWLHSSAENRKRSSHEYPCQEGGQICLASNSIKITKSPSIWESYNRFGNTTHWYWWGYAYGPWDWLANENFHQHQILKLQSGHLKRVIQYKATSRSIKSSRAPMTTVVFQEVLTISHTCVSSTYYLSHFNHS